MRAELKSDIPSPRSEIASGLMDFDTEQTGKHKHFRGQITGLHRAAMEELALDGTPFEHAPLPLL